LTIKPAFFIQVDIPLTINMNPGTQVNKLGASPQLECWNDSMIEAKTQTSKIPYIFIELYKFRDVILADG